MATAPDPSDTKAQRAAELARELLGARMSTPVGASEPFSATLNSLATEASGDPILLALTLTAQSFLARAFIAEVVRLEHGLDLPAEEWRTGDVGIRSCQHLSFVSQWG